MARLKHITSGAIVNVTDEKAVRLGSEWVPVDGSHASVSVSETPDTSWTIKNLKAYAEENAIEIGDAKKKDDILAAIAAGPAEGSGDDGDDEDESNDDGSNDSSDD